MIIDCISDLHGNFPKLEGGDLLIVAGDLTARDNPDGYFQGFADWVNAEGSKYNDIIVIAGNHDEMLQRYGGVELLRNCLYLCDSGVKIYYEEKGDLNNLISVPLDGTPLPDKKLKSLKIWGSPWTPWFEGVNPQYTAFMLPEAELEAKFALIPNDVDILVTHGPPLGILDSKNRFGSSSLRNLHFRRTISPKLHVLATYTRATEWKLGHLQWAVKRSSSMLLNAIAVVSRQTTLFALFYVIRGATGAAAMNARGFWVLITGLRCPAMGRCFGSYRKT